MYAPPSAAPSRLTSEQNDRRRWHLARVITDAALQKAPAVNLLETFCEASVAKRPRRAESPTSNEPIVEQRTCHVAWLDLEGRGAERNDRALIRRLVVAEVLSVSKAQRSKSTVSPASHLTALENGARSATSGAQGERRGADRDRGHRERHLIVADAVQATVSQSTEACVPPTPNRTIHEQRAGVSSASGDLSRGHAKIDQTRADREFVVSDALCVSVPKLAKVTDPPTENASILQERARMCPACRQLDGGAAESHDRRSGGGLIVSNAALDVHRAVVRRRIRVWIETVSHGGHSVAKPTVRVRTPTPHGTLVRERTYMMVSDCNRHRVESKIHQRDGVRRLVVAHILRAPDSQSSIVPATPTAKTATKENGAAPSIVGCDIGRGASKADGRHRAR